MKERAGKHRVNLQGKATYKSFIPAPLPPNPLIILDDECLKILIEANKNIATLESASSNIPNMQLFVSMYVRKEALLSSQIEGTQATLEDIFNPQEKVNSNRDVVDVVNYVKATLYALERLKTLPLCNKLLRETHAILLEGVRGSEKQIGEFRRSQNWIGAGDSTISNAKYIPPCVEDMQLAMSDLEKYINGEDEIDHLIKVSLIHYQFETIHPFLDGNGRIGRLLVTLYLIEKKVLNTPALYLSYFLKKNRVEYYDRMTEVRNSGNYEQWVKFFLSAISESAKNATETAYQLKYLHEKNSLIINQMGRQKKVALEFFHFLESNPIIEIGKTAKALSLSYNTVSSIVERFIAKKIITKTNDSRRNRIFIYTEYLDILRDGTL